MTTFREATDTIIPAATPLTDAVLPNDDAALETPLAAVPDYTVPAAATEDSADAPTLTTVPARRRRTVGAVEAVSAADAPAPVVAEGSTPEEVVPPPVDDHAAGVPTATASAATDPDVSLYAFDATWAANLVVMVGTPLPRRRDVTIAPSAGGRYTLHTLRVAEVSGSDQVGDTDVAQQEIPLLLPAMLSAAETALLHGTEPVTALGRVVQEQRRDGRYQSDNAFGGKLVTDMYVKVLGVRRLSMAQAAMITPYAVVQLTGTVVRVFELDAPLFPGRATRYHRVRLDVRVSIPRPAPAQGYRLETFPIEVAVPADLDHAPLMLRPGNLMQVECAFAQIRRTLGEGHYDLQGIEDAEQRRRRATQTEDVLVATLLVPQDGAQALTEEEHQRLSRATTRQARQARRQPRVVTLAEQGQEADAAPTDGTNEAA